MGRFDIVEGLPTRRDPTSIFLGFEQDNTPHLIMWNDKHDCWVSVMLNPPYLWEANMLTGENEGRVVRHAHPALK